MDDTEVIVIQIPSISLSVKKVYQDGDRQIAMDIKDIGREEVIRLYLTTQEAHDLMKDLAVISGRMN